MKTKQEKIEEIYEKIARKDLSFGCKFKLKSGAITTATGEGAIWINCLFFGQVRMNNIDKIIGHPVMIGDVLDFALKNKMKKYISDIKEELIQVWIIDLRKPIEEQSDECIDFVYNLIK